MNNGLLSNAFTQRGDISDRILDGQSGILYSLKPFFQTLSFLLFSQIFLVNFFNRSKKSIESLPCSFHRRLHRRRVRHLYDRSRIPWGNRG